MSHGKAEVHARHGFDLCSKEYQFEDFEKCRDFFKELINDLRQMNYTEFHSEAFEEYANKTRKITQEYGN